MLRICLLLTIVGRYIMKQYGHRLVDENSNIYQCTLILERENGQKAITEILEFPPPSKVDDWALYNRIVGDHIRARQVGTRGLLFRC